MMNASVEDTNQAIRELNTVLKGQQTADGAGVQLTRYIGSPELNHLDPFLLFDVFESDQASDYIGGFPSHPHRGFETVTYLLAGKMRHRDNAGHEGVIEAGGLQWMTAGRGIVHSEFPEQEQGLLHGFQLWVNLPAKHKMTAPAYQEFHPGQIPESFEADIRTRVLAGKLYNGFKGPVQNDYVKPMFLDVSMSTGQRFEETTSRQQTVFLYVISGALEVGSLHRKLKAQQLGVLTAGERIELVTEEDSRWLLLAANPLNEPIVRAGPFVMNTREEILTAFKDFENNRF